MEFLYVEEFDDDPSSETDHELPPKQRQKYRTWLKKQEFANVVNAEKAIDPIWKKCSVTATVLG
jgi:hypothetical protein